MHICHYYYGGVGLGRADKRDDLFVTLKKSLGRRAYLVYAEHYIYLAVSAVFQEIFQSGGSEAFDLKRF